MRRAAWRAVPAAGSHGPGDVATPSPHAAPRSAPVNLRLPPLEELTQEVAIDMKVGPVTYRATLPARRLRELTERVDQAPRLVRDDVFVGVLRALFRPHIGWWWLRSPAARFWALDLDRRATLIDNFLAAMTDVEPMPVCTDTP